MSDELAEIDRQIIELKRTRAAISIWQIVTPPPDELRLAYRAFEESQVKARKQNEPHPQTDSAPHEVDKKPQGRKSST